MSRPACTNRECSAFRSSDSVHFEEARGDAVCTECGVVVEESNIVAAVEFQESAGGSSSVIGQYISGTATRPYGASGPGYGLSRESREVAMENGRRLIMNLATKLSLSAHFVDSAHRLYCLAIENRWTSGRKSSHVIATCLYIVCRREKTAHLLMDFSEALQTNVYSLGATFLKLSRLLNLQIPFVDPVLYIHRFAARMNLGDKVADVTNTALKLVHQMKRDWINTGRRPAGVCGACLLIASRIHGVARSRLEIQQVVRVTDLTLRNRLTEFESTNASLLSMDAFTDNTFEVELDGQATALDAADPPSFVRGQLEAALVQARALLEDAYTDGDGLEGEGGGAAAAVPFLEDNQLFSSSSSSSAAAAASSSQRPQHAGSSSSNRERDTSLQLLEQIPPSIPPLRVGVSSNRSAAGYINERTTFTGEFASTIAAILGKSNLAKASDFGVSVSSSALEAAGAGSRRLGGDTDRREDEGSVDSSVQCGKFGGGGDTTGIGLTWEGEEVEVDEEGLEAGSLATGEESLERDDAESLVGGDGASSGLNKVRPEALAVMGTPAAIAAAAEAAGVNAGRLAAAAMELGLTPLTVEEVRMLKARALLQSSWANGKRALQRFRASREKLALAAINKVKAVEAAAASADAAAAEDAAGGGEGFASGSSLLDAAEGLPQLHDAGALPVIADAEEAALSHSSVALGLSSSSSSSGGGGSSTSALGAPPSTRSAGRGARRQQQAEVSDGPLVPVLPSSSSSSAHIYGGEYGPPTSSSSGDALGLAQGREMGSFSYFEDPLTGASDAGFVSGEAAGAALAPASSSSSSSGAAAAGRQEEEALGASGEYDLGLGDGAADEAEGQAEEEEEEGDDGFERKRRGKAGGKRKRASSGKPRGRPRKNPAAAAAEEEPRAPTSLASAKKAASGAAACMDSMYHRIATEIATQQSQMASQQFSATASAAPSSSRAAAAWSTASSSAASPASLQLGSANSALYVRSDGGEHEEGDYDDTEGGAAAGGGSRSSALDVYALVLHPTLASADPARAPLPPQNDEVARKSRRLLFDRLRAEAPAGSVRFVPQHVDLRSLEEEQQRTREAANRNFEPPVRNRGGAAVRAEGGSSSSSAAAAAAAAAPSGEEGAEETREVESFSDIGDGDVADYLLDEEDVGNRVEVWTEMHGAFVREKREKAEKEAMQQGGGDGATAAAAASEDDAVAAPGSGAEDGENPAAAPSSSSSAAPQSRAKRGKYSSKLKPSLDSTATAAESSTAFIASHPKLSKKVKAAAFAAVSLFVPTAAAPSEPASSSSAAAAPTAPAAYRSNSSRSARAASPPRASAAGDDGDEDDAAPAASTSASAASSASAPPARSRSKGATASAATSIVPPNARGGPPTVAPAAAGPKAKSGPVKITRPGASRIAAPTQPMAAADGDDGGEDEFLLDPKYSSAPDDYAPATGDEE